MRDGGNLFVGIARIELHIPEARSLKDRRRAVRPLVDRLKSRFRVLVIETGHADLHQRASLAICAASTKSTDLEARLQRVHTWVEENWPGVILEWKTDTVLL